MSCLIKIRFRNTLSRFLVLAEYDLSMRFGSFPSAMGTIEEYKADYKEEGYRRMMIDASGGVESDGTIG